MRDVVSLAQICTSSNKFPTPPLHLNGHMQHSVTHTKVLPKMYKAIIRSHSKHPTHLFLLPSFYNFEQKKKEP